MMRLANVLAFFFGPKAPPAHRQAPPPSALDAVCERYGCRYERSVVSRDEVQIMLIRPDATLAATGPTTAAAVEAIVIKADKCWGAL